MSKTDKKHPKKGDTYIKETTKEDGTIQYHLFLCADGREDLELLQSPYLHPLYSYLMNSFAVEKINPPCRERVLEAGCKYADDFLTEPTTQLDQMVAEIELLDIYYSVEEKPQSTGGKYVH